MTLLWFAPPKFATLPAFRADDSWRRILQAVVKRADFVFLFLPAEHAMIPMTFLGCRATPNWAILFLLGAVGISYSPLLMFGAPAGNSGYLNLSWFAAFSDQFLAGDLYPRWLPNLKGGGGSPVFYFYGPLPFWWSTLTGSFICHGCRVDYQLAIGLWLLALASALSFYLFARRFVGVLPAAVAAFIYSVLPYHYEIDLLRRAALGEVMIYLLMPLALEGVYRMAERSSWVPVAAIVYALLILNHLPSALLFSIGLAAFTAALALEQRNAALLWRFAVSVLLGCGIAALYLLPALVEQDTISAHFWSKERLHYSKWFLFDSAYPPTEFKSVVQRGFLVAAGFGTLFWVLTLAVAKKAFRFWWHWPLFGGLTLLLVTPVSGLLWAELAILQRVQFPWRALVMADLGCAMSVAAFAQYVLCGTERRLRLLGIGGVGALLLSIALPLIEARYSFAPFQDPQGVAAMWRNFELGVDAAEYSVPSTKISPPELPARMAEVPFLATTAGEAELVSRTAERIVFNVASESDVTVQVRQFLYPIWKATTAVGQEVELFASDPEGVICLSLPAGSHRVEIVAEPLPSEILGGKISAGSLLVLVGMLIVWRRPRGGRPSEGAVSRVGPG